MRRGPSTGSVSSMGSVRPISSRPEITVNCGGAVNAAVIPMKCRRPKAGSAAGPMNTSSPSASTKPFSARYAMTGSALASNGGRPFHSSAHSAGGRCCASAGTPPAAAGRRCAWARAAGRPARRSPGSTGAAARRTTAAIRRTAPGTGSSGCCPAGGRSGRGAAGTPHRSRAVHLDDPVEVANVDAQLQGGGRDDHAVARLGERLLGPPPFVSRQRGVGQEHRHAFLAQGGAEFFDQLP